MTLKDVRASVRLSGNLVKETLDLINNKKFSALSGMESFGAAEQQLNGFSNAESGVSAFGRGLKQNVNASNFSAIASSMGRTDYLDAVKNDITDSDVRAMAKREGLEGFTMNNFEGSSATTKAVNIVLNTQTRLQTAAAEQLYKTIQIKYEDEGVRMNVRAAGVGSYVNGANAWESMTELTPIFGVLRTGDLFKDDLLRIYPVFPEEESDDNYDLFLDPTIKPATPANYASGDAYGRQDHLTQMLAVPASIPSLLGLCQAPGQRGWTDTDDIESASIRITEVGVEGTLDGTKIQFFIDTSSMTNTNMAPTSIGQNSNDRDVDISLRHVAASQIVDDEGASAKALFQAFYTAGYEPNLHIRMTGRYNRQTTALSLTTGKVVIESLTRLSDGARITHVNGTDAEKVLMRKLQGSTVNGATPEMNLTNANNGNFGYRLEVYDANKELTTNRQTPVSVKYPVRAEDVNKESLDDAISYMGVTIQTRCSRKAFDEAFNHFDYLRSIDGQPVVDNNTGGNDLPGRMFCRPAAVLRSLRIQDHISSPDNVDVFENICALVLYEIQDIAAALEFKSNIAAINEYSGVEKTKWTVIAHQNLARFLMRVGDSRISALQNFEIVPTNFDLMIGKIFIIPTNDSTEDRINPLAGVGVNVAKENIVLHGNVTRGTVDYGVMMTMPCYRQWNLNVLMGRLDILDAVDFLDDNGVFSKLGGVNVRTAPGQSVATTAGAVDPDAVSKVELVNTEVKPVFTKDVTAP